LIPTTDRVTRLLLCGAVVAFGLVGCHTGTDQATHATMAQPGHTSTSTASAYTPPPGVVAAEQARYEAMQKGIADKYGKK